MVLPIFLGVVGLCLVMALGAMARMQMLDLVHQASRTCIIDNNYDKGSLSGCIAAQVSQLASQPYAFVKICDLSAPLVQGPDQVNALDAAAPIYGVRTSLKCSFSLGLPLIRSLPGMDGTPAFALGVTSTTPYLPRLNTP